MTIRSTTTGILMQLVVLNQDKAEKRLSLELITLSGLRRFGWKPGHSTQAQVRHRAVVHAC